MMQRHVPRRSLALAAFLFALLIAGANLFPFVPAHAHHPALLKTRLAATEPGAFRQALKDLAAMDEPGALALWQEAIKHPDSELRKEAWAVYRNVRAQLERDEFVPQVVRVNAPPEEVTRLASSVGLEVNIWSAEGGGTVAAAPPYLVERLRRAGLLTEILYDSISEWQRECFGGDAAAVAITPQYQKDTEAKSQVRIAVIERARRSRPAAGYSDWLGDHEDIVMSNDSFIAYLDIFSGEVSTHIEERYTRRGYRLAGFYTPEEFADNVSRFFPGQKFDAGASALTTGAIRPALSEGKFHSYEETLAEFTELARAHPNIARVVELGTTYENRKIFALKVSKSPEVDDSSKPDMLITGAYHAREWISVEPPVYIAKQLIDGYAGDDLLRHLIDRLQIWIVPIVNPDGLTYSQGSANDRLDGARLWRKNRRPIAVEGCGSSVGVDLNRNFDYQWRLRGDEPCPNYSDDSGGSDKPDNEIYRGPRADSEQEVRAIKSLLDDPNRRFRAQVDYHSYSQLILYPWGYDSSPTPDDDVIGSLAQEMSDAMFQTHRVRYEPRQAFNLYNTTGSSIDYAYGAKGTPAPFLIELRPTCCNFNTPESEIGPINEENWAGLRPVLDWAAGPPILEAVQAYQAGPDGNFSKLVYSARWASEASGNTRLLALESRFPRLEPGRLQVRLQFSGPMSIVTHPQATLGRGGQFDELTFVAEDGTQGWRKTVYENDTWIGETAIPPDGSQPDPWRLAIAALDPKGLNLDAKPATVAGYVTGASGWQGYENADGAGTTGGTDTSHLLAPTITGDFFSVFVAEPNGGERLAGGEPYTVIWAVQEHPSFIPVQHTVSLSTNSGGDFFSLVEFVPGNLEKYTVTLPRIPTTRARIRISSREGVFDNSIYGDSETDFSICDDVGSAVSIGFVSSERIDLNWSDTPFDNPAGTVSGSARFIVTLNLTNNSDLPIANPFVRVADLTGGNVLLTRDVKSNQAAGARQSIDAGGDNLIAPGETVQVRLTVGLVEVKKKFTLAVELYGVPVGGSITSADPVVVWKKKPKNKGVS